MIYYHLQFNFQLISRSIQLSIYSSTSTHFRLMRLAISMGWRCLISILGGLSRSWSSIWCKTFEFRAVWGPMTWLWKRWSIHRDCTQRATWMAWHCLRHCFDLNIVLFVSCANSKSNNRPLIFLFVFNQIQRVLPHI